MTRLQNKFHEFNMHQELDMNLERNCIFNHFLKKKTRPGLFSLPLPSPTVTDRWAQGQTLTLLGSTTGALVGTPRN